MKQYVGICSGCRTRIEDFKIFFDEDGKIGLLAECPKCKKDVFGFTSWEEVLNNILGVVH